MVSLPAVSIPEPIQGLEPGSWAERTVKIRFVETIQRTIAENGYSGEYQRNLNLLASEIPAHSIRPIQDPDAPDSEDWQVYIDRYIGQNWLQPPWFVIEHYFYRRIIEAVGYFQPGAGNGLDPFRFAKRAGLKQSRTVVSELAKRLNEWISVPEPSREILQSILYLDLWGNQADYSLWPADAAREQKPDHENGMNAFEYLLVDESLTVVDYILERSGAMSRIDFLIDNAGMELLSDLVFADYLLTMQISEQVQFHLKAHPTFVSDALPKDVEGSILFLEAAKQSEVVALGRRLRRHLGTQKLILRPSYFWNSPLDGWQMPEQLGKEIGNADLVFCKGDAHYRRLLGDRHWPYITPFVEISTYFPAPLAALRTLKSELVCGLKLGQAEKVARVDPDWMINGRWGLVQSNIQSTLAGTGVKK